MLFELIMQQCLIRPLSSFLTLRPTPGKAACNTMHALASKMDACLVANRNQLIAELMSWWGQVSGKQGDKRPAGRS